MLGSNIAHEVARGLALAQVWRCAGDDDLYNMNMLVEHALCNNHIETVMQALDGGDAQAFRALMSPETATPPRPEEGDSDGVADDGQERISWSTLTNLPDSQQLPSMNAARARLPRKRLRGKQPPPPPLLLTKQHQL